MGITSKISDGVSWLADKPKNNWTIGPLLASLTNGEINPRSMSLNRAGRIIERGIFVAGMGAGIAGCIFMEHSIVPMVPVFLLTKLAGYMGGGVAHVLADKAAPIAHAVDRAVHRFMNKKPIGVRPADANGKTPKSQKAFKENKPVKQQAPQRQQASTSGLKSISKGIVKAMDWINTEPHFHGTLINLAYKLVGKEYPETPYTRLGRLAERATTLSILGACAIGIMAGGGSVPLIAGIFAVCAPFWGAGVGMGVGKIGKVLGGVAHVMDRAISRNRAKTADQIFDEVGARMSPSPQNGIGVTPTGQKQSLRSDFAQSAAKPQETAAQPQAGARPSVLSKYVLDDTAPESAIVTALKANAQQQRRL